MNAADTITELRTDAQILHTQAFAVDAGRSRTRYKSQCQDKLAAAKAEGSEALIEVSNAMEGPAWRNLLRAALSTGDMEPQVASMIGNILDLNFDAPHSEDHFIAAEALVCAAGDVLEAAEVAA